MPGTAFTKTASSFRSRGTLCRGDLYLPEGVKKPPVVVMAHGFGAERCFGLAPFAEHFAGSGMAVLLFDYRCFGESEGEPRNLVDPFRHLQDWRSALVHVEGLAAVDGSRAALWGNSFSGGHVLVTAARHPSVRAVVSQVPFTSGIGTFTTFSPSYLARAIAAGARDWLGRLFGAGPYWVKVIGPPEEFAAMNTPDSYPGFSALIPDGSTWQNRFPAGALLQTPLYNPFLWAGRIRCPVLMIAARHDALAPEPAARRTAQRIADCRYHVLDCGHFDPYRGALLSRVLDLETSFLLEQLAPAMGPARYARSLDP